MDLPTLGKPMSATRPWPYFDTSNPSPSPPPDFAGARSCVRSFASFDFKMPRWPSVALFFCVLLISSSMSDLRDPHLAGEAREGGGGERDEGARGGGAEQRRAPSGRECEGFENDGCVKAAGAESVAYFSTPPRAPLARLRSRLSEEVPRELLSRGVERLRQRLLRGRRLPVHAAHRHPVGDALASVSRTIGHPSSSMVSRTRSRFSSAARFSRTPRRRRLTASKKPLRTLARMISFSSTVPVT